MEILDHNGQPIEDKPLRHEFGKLRIPEDCRVKFGRVDADAKYPYRDGYYTPDAKPRLSAE